MTLANDASSSLSSAAILTRSVDALISSSRSSSANLKSSRQSNTFRGKKIYTCVGRAFS